ncbi:DUF2066 domain-containing protein [Muricoccus radiodurans]|uniref:DUF2066 domain-containing protein n=1 Tax=Muricoccus radiodurans TaxID=2231721 RepID=UPI003CE6E9FE
MILSHGGPGGRARTRIGRRAVLAAPFAALVPCARAAEDVDLPDALTTATVRTDAPGRSDRGPALRRALGLVLAKLSGNPGLESDARVDAMDPAPLVLDLSYQDVLIDKPVHDEQGTRDRPYLLTVRFDPGGLRGALAALGERPWVSGRGRIGPMLTLRFRDGRETMLTGDDPLLDRPRAALTDAGVRYAMAIALPLMGAVTVPRGADRVDGSVTWVEAEFGWRATFRLRGDEWGVSGASLDEAFRAFVGGAALRLRPGGVAGAR